MSFDVINNWHKELEVMNHNKRGRKFDYPDSFMKLLGYARIYFGLPFRQTEGMIRAYSRRIPAIPDFTSIHKRVNKLDIKIDENSNGDDDQLISKPYNTSKMMQYLQMPNNSQRFSHT